VNVRFRVITTMIYLVRTVLRLALEVSALGSVPWSRSCDKAKAKAQKSMTKTKTKAVKSASRQPRGEALPRGITHCTVSKGFVVHAILYQPTVRRRRVMQL